jgi:VanZ family protein
VGRYSPGYRLYLIATWNLFIVLTGYGTYLSLVPAPGAAFEQVWDKLLHVTGWFVLTLSLRAAWPKPRLPWLAVFGLLAYSLLIEILQDTVPNRQFDLWDLVSNGIGILLAYGLSLLIWPSIERHFMSRLR